jgi:hypothetical protein
MRWLDRTVNPVEKAVLQVHRYENQLVIDELLLLGAVLADNGDALLVANCTAGINNSLESSPTNYTN